MPRKKKKSEQPPAGGAKPVKADGTPSVKQPDRFDGRLASDVVTRDKAFFWHPFVPIGVLTLVVGQPSVGKSTFLAALIAHATGAKTLEDRVKRKPGKAIVLTGQEEDVEVMTVPRLIAAGVDLTRVKLIEHSDVALIRDQSKLIATAKAFGATLIVADPMDNYLDEGITDIDPQGIRAALESAVAVAQQCKLAFVGVRHPGKDPTNICPGSRQWKAVSKSIVQLVKDESFPPVYYISHWRDSMGTHSLPVRYELVRDDEGPPVLRLVQEVEKSTDEMLKMTFGAAGRWKLQAACGLIRWLFDIETNPTRIQLGEEGRKQGIGEDTVNDAMRLLGVRSVPPGKRGAAWELIRTSDQWPSWVKNVAPPSDPPELSEDVGDE